MNDTLRVVCLPVLLSLSAFFSASETALFSLNPEDRTKLAESNTRSARCALQLLSDPRSLLVVVLFGNLLVNFLLLALTAKLLDRLAEAGVWGLVLGGLLSTGLLIVFGEIVPKAIAVTRPRAVAAWLAPPLLVFRQATRVITRPLSRVVTLLLDVAQVWLPPPPGPLSDRELRRFVELHGEEGEFAEGAAQFLASVLELGSRRAHEVMTPRVDLVVLPLEDGPAALLEVARAHRLGKVLVHDGRGVDHISGYVRTRDVLARSQAGLAELVQPLWFVPHTKSLESLLRGMVERHEPVALVVGEYGGTQGLVTLEDVVEEITGDIAREDAPPLLEEGPDDTWTLAGRFPLREFAELLGLKTLEESSAATLSGFLAQKLGRIPEVGDLVWVEGVQVRVEKVERRRVRRVRLALPSTDWAPGGGAAEDASMTRSGAFRAHERLERRLAESRPGRETEQRKRPLPPGEDEG